MSGQRARRRAWCCRSPEHERADMKDGGTGEGEEERKEKGDVGRGLRLLFDIEPDKYATSFTICLTFSR